MARLVLISPYLKGGKHSARLANLTRYLATRPGVEKLEARRDLPATEGQKSAIRRFLRSFPAAGELLEYEDYQEHPTRGNADAFLRQAREELLEPLDQRENFLSYMAHRPGVQKEGDHGLWDADGRVPNLSRAVRELAEHPGNVWTPVIALRREDAERLGYDHAEAWRSLVCACLPEIAQGYKIHPDHLRWYAAFHQKERQVHIHMVIFSTDPKEGYLTKAGIRQVKSAFARRIYQQDLLHVYEQKTAYRNTLQREARQAMAELIQQIKTGAVENPRLELLLEDLARRLRTTKGRKVYGYLPPRTKAVVDAIVDELAKDPRVAQAYALWYQMREEICRSYSEAILDRLPLSQQKEFKAVRNSVVREALKLDLDQEHLARPGPKASRRPAEQAPPEAAAQPEPSPDGGGAVPPVPRYPQHQAEAPAPHHGRLLPAAAAAVRLFHDLGRLFEDNSKTDLMHRGIQMDRKRRRQLLEKRLALGHRADDHEEQTMEQQ